VVIQVINELLQKKFVGDRAMGLPAPAPIPEEEFSTPSGVSSLGGESSSLISLPSSLSSSPDGNSSMIASEGPSSLLLFPLLLG